jgi:hypothetical protein
MKTDVNVPSKRNKQKTLKNNLFFVGILSATDEKSRIRIRMSVVQIRIHNTDVSFKIIFFGKARGREGGVGRKKCGIKSNSKKEKWPTKTEIFSSCLKVIDVPRETFSKSLEIIHSAYGMISAYGECTDFLKKSITGSF